MDRKIISEHRYSKITIDRKKNREKKIKAQIKSKVVKSTALIKPKKQDFEYKEAKKEFDSHEIKGFFKTTLKVLLACCILILVGLLSKYLYNKKSDVVEQQASSNVTNNVNLVENYDLKIGIMKLGNTDIIKNSNILLNELIKLSNPGLVKVSDGYEITNILAESIAKNSDTEYEIKLKETIDVTPEEVKSTIDSIKSAASENAFYKKVENIDSINDIAGKSFKIKLKTPDQYFVYNLDFPVFSIKQASEYKAFNFTSWENNSFKFARNDKYSKKILNSINISDYQDNDSLVSDFKNDKIDVFLTSSYNTMQLLGKHEYSFKKYRNGETIFLFGNKNSGLFSKKEVRQAISYSINRDDILKNVNISYAETIDIPFIFSETKFRYDTYGASNVMITNGWRRTDGIYKKGDSIAELNLLVNDQDIIKISIAEKIKEMVESSGIRINVIKLNPDALGARVNQGDFDLILSSVMINENPNVSYLENFLNINDITKEAFNKVYSSKLEDLKTNIDNLQNVLSSEVACIGILAKDTNVVYQKYISGFEKISYFNIFKNLENIGKLK